MFLGCLFEVVGDLASRVETIVVNFKKSKCNAKKIQVYPEELAASLPDSEGVLKSGRLTAMIAHIPVKWLAETSATEISPS